MTWILKSNAFWTPDDALSDNSDAVFMQMSSDENILW